MWSLRPWSGKGCGDTWPRGHVRKNGCLYDCLSAQSSVCFDEWAFNHSVIHLNEKASINSIIC